MTSTNFILSFNEISLTDISQVGGKNASLGEMFNNLTRHGINVPDGFAITADAYRLFLQHNNIYQELKTLLSKLDMHNYSNLAVIGLQARSLIASGTIPPVVVDAVQASYRKLELQTGITSCRVAVRSSATAEDLPTASFAGRMESYLNITGEQLTEALKKCYQSLYTDRAIKYRCDMGFVEMDIAISVGVQLMVRSDLASSGVAFTIDPDSGFNNVIVINGIWGLGENIVQGRVTPDEWVLFKPALHNTALDPVLKKRCGGKEYTLVYGDESESDIEKTIINHPTPAQESRKYSLTTGEVKKLALWCYQIEQHYGKAMDIEWAKDGLSKKMYIVQARPETVHSKGRKTVTHIYRLHDTGTIIARGIALGNKIAAGKARILNSPADGHLLQQGEILVTDITNPDWDPILKRAAAIITNKGGRTSHAAIIARELGTVAIVGCGNATNAVYDGQEITVSCAQGKEGVVYDGLLKWDTTEQDYSKLAAPQTVSPLLILADADRAMELSYMPCMGVGLLRLEFAIANSIRIHPLALCEPEKIADTATRQEIDDLITGYTDGREYFIDKLAQSVAWVAAAFYPKEVIVRMSDFKSNEYANLLGGKYFEPQEENPMIGLRGASRYYSDFYRKGFALECAAMKKVRNAYGMTNVKLMIPFCRTVEEGKKVIAEMESNGLVQHVDDLEIYMMVEVPGNVVSAEEFAKIFDGFSIGSNDLTQLTLGLDRDSVLVSHLFNENNPAVKSLISETIRVAKRNKIKVGLCGQAPSDMPEFAQFLVDAGIDSISFNPDALIRGIENILLAETHVEINHSAVSS